MPFLFLSNPGVNDDTIRRLALVYDFYERDNSSGSGYSDVTREDTLTYVVTLNNKIVVLSTQFYCNVPLAKNVESWEILEPVNIGSYAAIVNGSEWKSGYDCWTCQLEDGSLVAYDKATGVLIYGEWHETYYQRVIQLLEMNYTDPFQPWYIMMDGFILAGIFVELAVVTWLFVFRVKKPD
jgi:hypothetical protein